MLKYCETKVVSSLLSLSLSVYEMWAHFYYYFNIKGFQCNNFLKLSHHQHLCLKPNRSLGLSLYVLHLSLHLPLLSCTWIVETTGPGETPPLQMTASRISFVQSWSKPHDHRWGIERRLISKSRSLLFDTTLFFTRTIHSNVLITEEDKDPWSILLWMSQTFDLSKLEVPDSELGSLGPDVV